MKRILFILLATILILSCDDTGGSDTETGTLTVNLSDSPIDTSNLEIINIRINEISANVTGEGWQIIKSFDPALDINLLDWTGGSATTLVEAVELPAVGISGIHFVLDAPEVGEDGSNPGCYLFYDYGEGTSTAALYIPAGSSSGFEVTTDFEIPSGDSITVTADFDARKSLYWFAEQERNMLDPVIRVVVDNETGRIEGNVTISGDGYDSSRDEAVYAYAPGVYSDSEKSEDPAFPNSVNSGTVEDDGSYVLPFLTEGNYDLVVARYTDGVYIVDYTVYEQTVAAGQTTTHDINIE